MLLTFLIKKNMSMCRLSQVIETDNITEIISETDVGDKSKISSSETIYGGINSEIIILLHQTKMK